jgi:glycosyltransferase involved in cell wall biosynthesis
MATGTKVLAADASGLVDALSALRSDRRSYRLVAGRDPEMWGVALRDLLAVAPQPEHVLHSEVMQTYAIGRAVAQYLSLYERLIKHRYRRADLT